MTEPSEFSEPADNPETYGYIDIGKLEAKIDVMAQQIEWLCMQLAAIMQVAQSNPMVRMAMNKAQKGTSNG
jgi:hypothetical protein